MNVVWQLMTYHSRAGIGDLSLERYPLIVGPLFVSKRPQEGPPDVIHGVETHSRAFKYTAAGGQGDRVKNIKKHLCFSHFSLFYTHTFSLYLIWKHTFRHTVNGLWPGNREDSVDERILSVPCLQQENITWRWIDIHMHPQPHTHTHTQGWIRWWSP